MPACDIPRILLDRRSIRRYTDEPVTRDQILAILEAGRWAPSGKNGQPWRFLALRRGDVRVEALAGCTRHSAIVRSAAALIVVVLDKSRMYHPMKDHQAAGACLQNMLLAIHGMGLGGVWIGEIVDHAPEALEALGLPGETFDLMAVVALGHPAGHSSSSRLPLNELLLEEF